MILLSANNASTTLAAGLASGTTTVILAAGAGTMFPSLAANEYFTLTLCDALTQTVYEVCWCTARTGDSLTVMRAQEGTSARDWLIGDYAYNTLTAATEASARAYSATNNPMLPFTIPVAHLGVTQICQMTGTITLPNTSGIADGFFVTILCPLSTAAVTVNTNSATVALPSGNVTTSFAIARSPAWIALQWSALENAWLLVSTSPTSPKTVQAVFNAGGTFTVPPNTGSLTLRLWGGGGGGGYGDFGGGGGGGAGGYVEGLADLNAGTALTIGVALAGSGGTNSAGATAGGNSSVSLSVGGLIAAAYGGQPGAAGVANNIAAGGAPGYVSGLTYPSYGETGYEGSANTTFIQAGTGGGVMGYQGGKGVILLAGNNAPGNNAQTACGGSGGIGTGNGGNGGSGLVIIEYTVYS